MAKAVKEPPKKKPVKGMRPVGAKVSVASARRLKAPTYKSFKLQKRIKPAAVLPGAFRIMWRSWLILGRNWKIFLGIVLIFALLNIILVRSFAGTGNFTALKESIDTILRGDFGQLAGGAMLFAYLLGSSGNTASPTAGAFQLIITLIVSLALIWTLRHAYAKRKLRVRDGFYLGMYPLVPFLLVLGVVGLQLVPMAIGIGLYTVIVGNGIAATVIEQVAWAVVFFSLMLVSLYMIASSVFALYMVTLPDMTPLKALRSARKLVANRRFMVIRKLLFLPLTLVVLAGVIVIPLILFATALAPWVFFAVSMLLIPLVHGYMYTLYRELL